jgi:hypothetical protein
VISSLKILWLCSIKISKEIVQIHPINLLIKMYLKISNLLILDLPYISMSWKKIIILSVWQAHPTTSLLKLFWIIKSHLKAIYSLLALSFITCKFISNLDYAAN